MNFSYLLRSSIKKMDLADFCQKMAMLICAGYDSCHAAELLAMEESRKRRFRDHSADGVRRVAKLLLPALRDGAELHTAMSVHPKIFGMYITQVELGESAGKTAEVLDRISKQIKNANRLMNNLQGAMVYPAIVLTVAILAATYLFTDIVPEMLQMLASIGAAEVPPLTQLVTNIGIWMQKHGLFLLAIIILLITVLTVYGKTVGQKQMAKLATCLPLFGNIIRNNSMALYFKNWEQMALAGAEMSVALKSAADAVPNHYIKSMLMDIQSDCERNGKDVYDAMRGAEIIREIEIQTIKISIETNTLTRNLATLSVDREYEAQKAIDTLTTAVAPIMILFVGAIVGVLVFAIYEPIISVSSSLG